MLFLSEMSFYRKENERMRAHQNFPVIRGKRCNTDRLGANRIVNNGDFNLNTYQSHIISSQRAAQLTIVPSAHPSASATSGSTSTVSASFPPILARELAAARPDHPRYAALAGREDDELDISGVRCRMSP
jgi:hypothetical protein